MLMHEKIMSGQFLLDLKNDRTSLLHHAAQAQLHPTSHHQIHAHHQHQLPLQLPAHYALQQQLPPSPPMSDLKLDMYSAYAYQQQLQQQLTQQQQTLIGDQQALNHHQQQQQQQFLQQQQQQQQQNQSALVLDLSRRGNSAENSPSRQTCSPSQSHSSCGTASPIASPRASPTSSQSAQQAQQTQAQIPANLIYSTQAQTGAPLAALYPTLYYPGIQVKQELVSPPLAAEAAVVAQTQFSAAKNLLQSFASAAAVVAATSSRCSSSSSPSASHFDEDEEINVMRCTPQMPVNAVSSSGVAAAAAAAAYDTAKTTTTTTAATRPFKVFPRDPLVIAAKFEANDGLHEIPRGVERYAEYRKRVLEQIRSSNGGERTVTNPKMRRINTSNGSPNGNSESDERVRAAADADAAEDYCSDTESQAANNSDKQSSAGGAADGNSNQKDAAYYERRRKNNAAAKKSRDRRRIKEDEIAIRAAYLERQNIELLCQIDALKAQLAAVNAKLIA